MVWFPAFCAADAIDVGFDAHWFAHNLEFVGKAAEYRTGETFFGQHLTVQAVYLPTDQVTIAGGFFLATAYGVDDEQRWDHVEPAISFTYRPDENFGLRFGNLDPESHTFLPALYHDVVRYEQPTETGLEVNTRLGRFAQNCWLNWQQLNTAEHREKFDIGAIARLDLQPAELDAQLYYVHRGGQLFNSGPVTDNTAVALGGTVDLRFLTAGLAGSGLAAHWFLAKNVAARSDPAQTGKGAEVTAFAAVLGWELFCSCWWGNSFLAEDGLPLYRADELLSAGFRKQWHLSDEIRISLGFTGYRLDGTYPHSAWLTIDAARRPGAKSPGEDRN